MEKIRKKRVQRPKSKRGKMDFALLGVIIKA